MIWLQCREFVTLLGGAATTWPLAARGQQAEPFQSAFELNPNLADGCFVLILFQNGRARQGVDLMTRIMRLDPLPLASF
jgi:hypothetical protein